MMRTTASPDPEKHQTMPPTRMINVWWMLLALNLFDQAKEVAPRDSVHR